MAGLMSRNKGKRAEREIVNLLQPIVDSVYSEHQTKTTEVPRLQRNTLQSDRGGFDITGIAWFAPEVKHQEQLNINVWWAQCKAQAKPGQEAVLFYRKNGTKWRVRMVARLSLEGTRVLRCTVDISMPTFCSYFRERLWIELRNLQPKETP